MNSYISSQSRNALALLIVLGAILYVLIPKQATAPKQEQIINDVPYDVVVMGLLTCLPTTIPENIQEECVYGLQAPDKKYYLLDVTSGEFSLGAYTFETPLVIDALYVPIEQISTDKWQKYPIEGILSVKKITAQ